jgi:hypothetical protein
MCMSLCKEPDCYVCCGGVEVYNDGMCVLCCVEKAGGGGLLAHVLTHQPLASTSPTCASKSPSDVRPLGIICGHTRLNMAGAPGPIRKAWYQWKMQRFPWRKKWLVGECRRQHRSLAYPCFILLIYHRLRSPGQHILGVQGRTARPA